MAFNELNSVEHFIVHQLTGVNLNATTGTLVKESTAPYGDEVQWRYLPADLVPRELTDVLVEKELKEAICRLNPAIAEVPDRAVEVIHKLRTILLTVNHAGLVRANEEFSKWLRNEISLPLGKNNEHITIKLIDFDNLKNNSFVLCNQFKIRATETKIPDIVMFVNGIPLVGLMVRMTFIRFTKIPSPSFLSPISFRLQPKERTCSSVVLELPSITGPHGE